VGWALLCPHSFTWAVDRNMWSTLAVITSRHITRDVVVTMTNVHRWSVEINQAIIWNSTSSHIFDSENSQLQLESEGATQKKYYLHGQEVRVPLFFGHSPCKNILKINLITIQLFFLFSELLSESCTYVFLFFAGREKTIYKIFSSFEICNFPIRKSYIFRFRDFYAFLNTF
jgi:hypothetical protein